MLSAVVQQPMMMSVVIATLNGWIAQSSPMVFSALGAKIAVANNDATRIVIFI